MIKLVVTDIDGTLLEDGHSGLNPEYYEVIRRLKKKGMLFAAASGRQYQSILSVFAPLKQEMIFIAENGAHITLEDQTRTVSVIDKDNLNQLIKDMRTMDGCEIFVSGISTAYIESKNQELYDLLVNGYKNHVTVVDDLLEIKEDCVKISLFCWNGVEKEAAPILIPRWSGRFQVVTAGELWLDIMNPNVNKGQAIEWIQEMYRISKDETMSFGDNLNDIEMMHQAKFSYAIGNAREEVKEAANYIADTNKNDGVLKVLKTLL